MKMKGLVLMLMASCLAVGCMDYEKRLKQCDSVGEFKDGYALCSQDGKYFFIDRDGKRMSDKYDEADEFANGYALVQRINPNGDYQIVILDKDCTEMHYGIRNAYGDVNQWGKLWVKVTGNMYSWAILDVQTGSLTPLLGYPDCLTQDGYAVVSRRINQAAAGSQTYYEYAIYDGQGNEVVPFGTYTFIGNISHGLAQYSTTGYFLFNGDHAFGSGHYDDDKASCRGLATKHNSPSQHIRLGYIDCKGSIVVPEQFHTATMFNKAGYARVGIGYYDHNRRMYVIDTKGNDCTGDVMAEASLLPDGIWRAGKTGNGECVLANNAGKTISFGFGCEIANTAGYTMIRKGTEYKLYRINEGNEEVECIASFIRSQGDELVVVNSSTYRGDRSRTDYIRFFNPHVSKGWGMSESPYDEYSIDGTHLESGWDRIYTVGGNGTVRFPVFSFI